MSGPVRRFRLTDIDPGPLLDRAQGVDPQVVQAAAAILEHVRRDGDAALRELTKRFDGADLADPWLGGDALVAMAQDCPTAVREALVQNLARIEEFHRLQEAGEQTLEVVPGVRLGRRPVPHRRVACYVPGGRASYPSTVLMTVAPARLAGVEEIIVVTPPRRDGTIDPAVAYAADLAGATRVLRAGGAQAIAALALGTDQVPRVDAIVGPGNAYVTAAKRLVSDRVAIDSPAGPSELLVLADGTADPSHVALDLMAQAEHDPDAQVLLVTDSDALADAVSAELEARVPAAARRDVIEASLRDQGLLLVADSMDDAIAFTDDYAAEHLEILTRDPHGTFRRIRNAGSVFLGPLAPVSLGDYGSGTNHVLPTMGFARFQGGLGLDHFRKWVTWQHVSADGLRRIGDDVATVADAEGLHAHADAVRVRLAGLEGP